MRKILCLFLVCLLFVSSLSACSAPKMPIDEQHVKYAQKALEIADAYLDFNLSAEEAYKKIDTLHDAEDSLPEGTPEQKTGNLLVESKVFTLVSAFYATSVKASGFSTAVSSDVLGARNGLADFLGVKAR